MLSPQYALPLHDELFIDNFAGGGGASTGIERAIGRPVDIAINHDPEAVAMHQANHPQTLHLCESVWDVDPREVTQGRPVGGAWFSPDCKHFSKAKGGKPVEKRIRGLAWVAVRWAATARPKVIYLENVEEFVTWGPLTADGRPCPRRKGREFGAFVNALQRLGYVVEHRELRACDFGAPTSRKRLFLIARRDGQPIVWPQPTHGPGRRHPWHTAAECIDWSLPCPSIFERGRPLADATLRRIARGIQRYVLDAPQPFIVRIGHTGHGDAGKVRPITEPLGTVTSKAEHLLAVPTLVQAGYGERPGQAPRAPGLDKPLGTIVAGGGKHALVAAFLAKHYGGNESPGAPLHAPMSTVTTQDHHHLVATHLLKLRGTSTGCASDAPVPTISAQGTHIAEVRAFLVKFYGSGGQWAGLDEPMHTVPTRDRMGLVTVAGQDYVIADIGMRMLQPRELARAQGFGDGYLLEAPHLGRPLPKHAQVRMIGNSVCPPMAEALVRANQVEAGAGRPASSMTTPVRRAQRRNRSHVNPTIQPSGGPCRDGHVLPSVDEGTKAAPRERPILFSAPMVRALLAGKKTQTRRAIKAPGIFVSSGAIDGHGVVSMTEAGIREVHCPYGQPGDLLWVRETWAPLTKGYAYRADPIWNAPPADRWRPSIHLPRAASRVTLEVAGVRVERLQDISRGDAMAEGCPHQNMADGADPRCWYASLWEDINGHGSWPLNPWVWVVEFRQRRNAKLNGGP